MELVRRDTGYGLRALLHMARQGVETTFTAEELAQAAATTVGFMHKIMRALRDAGIVEAKRGPSGGFRLARDPAEISLLAVVTAVQGPIAVNRCVIGLDICERSEHCPLRPTWLRIQEELESGLAGVSLATIAAVSTGAEGDDHDRGEGVDGDLGAEPDGGGR